MSLDLCLKQLHVVNIKVCLRVQHIRLLLFYSVIFQSVIFHSCKFQSPAITTTNYASWVVQTRVKQTLDGRRPPSWKIEKRPYLGNGLTNRHQIWYADEHWPYEPYRQLIYEFLKMQYGGRRDGRYVKMLNFLKRHFMQPFKPLQQNLAGWRVYPLWTQCANCKIVVSSGRPDWPENVIARRNLSH